MQLRIIPSNSAFPCTCSLEPHTGLRKACSVAQDAANLGGFAGIPDRNVDNRLPLHGEASLVLPRSLVGGWAHCTARSKTSAAIPSIPTLLSQLLAP
jgi:hypothetical protein